MSELWKDVLIGLRQQFQEAGRRHPPIKYAAGPALIEDLWAHHSDALPGVTLLSFGQSKRFGLPDKDLAFLVDGALRPEHGPALAEFLNLSRLVMGALQGAPALVKPKAGLAQEIFDYSLLPGPGCPGEWAAALYHMAERGSNGLSLGDMDGGLKAIEPELWQASVAALAVLTGLKADRRGFVNSPNDARDKFCYDQISRGKKRTWIRNHFQKSWETISSDQGVTQAAKRYAKRKNLLWPLVHAPS